MFTAVKRLMKEAAELREPTEHYHAQPLEVRPPRSPAHTHTPCSLRHTLIH